MKKSDALQLAPGDPVSFFVSHHPMRGEVIETMDAVGLPTLIHVSYTTQLGKAGGAWLNHDKVERAANCEGTEK